MTTDFLLPQATPDQMEYVRTQGLPQIHVSDIRSFKACRRRWDWSSSLRRNLTPRELYAPYFIGSLVHHCLAMLATEGQDPRVSAGEFLRAELGPRKPIFKEEVPQIRENVHLGMGMLKHYRRWSVQDRSFGYAESYLDHLATERRFVVPMFKASGEMITDFCFAGTWDGLVRHKQTNGLWLMEYKTARSISERLQLLVNDSQAYGYMYAAQQILGEPIEGTIYTILRKKLPETPRVLKNGMLSKSMSIETTAEHYLACVRGHHGVHATREFIRSNYGEILQELQSRGNQFIARVAIRRTQQELAQWAADAIDVMREMVNPDIPTYPTDGSHCTYCRFLDPCVAMTKRQEFHVLLEELYMMRPQEFAGQDTAVEV